jgi:hypothetical protein
MRAALHRCPAPQGLAAWPTALVIAAHCSACTVAGKTHRQRVATHRQGGCRGAFDHRAILARFDPREASELAFEARPVVDRGDAQLD